MSIDAEFLMARLPAFYRERDAEMGGPLRALLEVIAEQGAVLEEDITRLYDNTMTAESWQQLGVTTLVWLWIPLALGLRAVLRAEVK